MHTEGFDERRTDKKLIIVEDSPLLMRLLQDELKEAGYNNISSFENGKEAYDYIMNLAENETDLSKQIDMIITDIEMPKWTGTGSQSS